MAELFTPRRFIPAGTFAAIGALGLVSGMLSANASFAMMPEAEATLTFIPTVSFPWRRLMKRR